MTEKEKLHQTINRATNEELGLLYQGIAGFDPFKKHALLLPSLVRENTIKKLKQLIDDGAVLVKPAK